jgi:hypothetical protein
MNRWVRISANMSLGAYEVFEATGVRANVAGYHPFGNTEDRIQQPYR